MHREKIRRVRSMKAAPSPIVYERDGFFCVDGPSERAAQMIRIFDVLVIGPAMLYAASEVKNPALGAVLAISGAGTVLYNARNWLLVSRAANQKRTRGSIDAYQ